MPTVPFCPWRDANLSPICGMRTERTRTLTNLRPSWLVVSITWSTYPACRRTRVAPLVARLPRVHHLLGLLVERRRFADDDVVARHTRARRDQTVIVELRVVAPAHSLDRLAVGSLEALGELTPRAREVYLLLLVAVGAVEDRAEEATVDSRLVSEVEVRHGPRDSEWLLRVIEYVRQRVHPQLVVGDVDAHCLLAHRALVGVARRLVVVGEGDDRGADAEDHRRVDLAVRVAVHRVVGAQIRKVHCNHHCLLLLGVHELNQPIGEQLGEAEARLLLVAQLAYVRLLEEQFLLLDDEDGPAAPPRVRKEAQFARGNVAHHRDLCRNLEAAPQLAQRLDK
eukprot:scaffold3475_cov91-Phaeocystis_antarctica.AAC.2